MDSSGQTLLVFLFTGCFLDALQQEMTIYNSSISIAFEHKDIIRFFYFLCESAMSTTITFDKYGHIVNITRDNNSLEDIVLNDANIKDCLQMSSYVPFVCNFINSIIDCEIIVHPLGLSNVWFIKIFNKTICNKDYVVLYFKESGVKLQQNNPSHDLKFVDCKESNVPLVSGNTKDHEKQSETNMLSLIIGISVGGFLLLAGIIIIAVIIIYRRMNRKQYEKQNLAASNTSNVHKSKGSYEEIDDVLNNGYSLALPVVNQDNQDKPLKQALPNETSEVPTEVSLQNTSKDKYSVIHPKIVSPMIVPVTKQPDPSAADVNRVHIGGPSVEDESYNFKNVYSKLGQNNTQSRQNYDDISTLKASIESQNQHGSLSGQMSDTCGRNVINLEPSTGNIQPPPSEKIYSSL